MTAAPTPFDLGASYTASRAGERRFALAPAEGWSSVLLLVLMCALVGWAVDDAHWVLGSQSNTDFLPWAGAFAAAWGFVAAKLGRGRLVGHGLGAIIGVTFLIVATGSQLAPGDGLPTLVRVTADGVWGAFDDLVIHGRQTTDEIAHYLLVLGGLVWATGQFAGYAAYAHHRPLSAVVLPGTILVLNVSITILNQYAVLILFSLAALLFLVRFHVADEQRAWARHRIADVGNAVGLSLRAGLAFVALALVGSLVLTSFASSAPLSGWWHGLDQRLIDFGAQLARFFPSGGPGTSFGAVTFGPTVTIEGKWTSDDTPLITIRTEPGAPLLKWRMWAYDRLDANQWSETKTPVDPIPIPAGEALLAGTAELPTQKVATQTVSYVVTGIGGDPGQLAAPGYPQTVDQPAAITLVGEQWFGDVRVSGVRSYGATAAVPIVTEGVADALTANRLRAAGTQYPDGIKSIYLDLQPGTAGDDVKALLVTILDAAKPRTPYDTARAIEGYLGDPANGFQYQTDVLDVDCGGRGVADCFAVSRKGYCQHFATTMAVMLRLQGIPARMVQGYLPAVPDSSGVQTITKGQAHAGVEAYFPGYGWIGFDPTASQGQPQAIDEGPVVATPTPGPSGAGGTPGPTGRDPRGEPTGPTGGSTSPPRTPGIGPIIVILLPLGAVLLALAVRWIRRRLGRPVQPEIVYRTVVAMAGRLGHPRRPTQTVYEYLGTLSDAVPTARPELQLVARSTVESTYGRRTLSPDRLAALGEAQRRLRFALLRLLVPRRRR